MTKEELLDRVAPCSLMCHTCSGYCHGVLKTKACELLHYQSGLEEFLSLHMGHEAGQNFHSYENMLRFYTGANCPGCRKGGQKGSCIEGCMIPECTKAHGVDFCGQCEEFPCVKPGKVFEPQVLKQWEEGNAFIRDHGPEAFWEAFQRKPHYQAYKEE